jgi:hypothetical protein
MYCTCDAPSVQHHYREEKFDPFLTGQPYPILEMIYLGSTCNLCNRPWQPKKEKEMDVQLKQESEEELLKPLIKEALMNSWTITDKNFLIPPTNDIRNTWAARWLVIPTKERIIQVPHWLIDAPSKGWFIPGQNMTETKPIKDGMKVTNAQGGSQSFLLANFASIPPEVLKLLAQCLGFGAMKYGDRNWEKVPMSDNLSHAMNHINEWNLGDRSEPHLVNAMARLTFALSLAVNSGAQPANYTHPDMEKVLAEKFKPKS